MKLLELYSLATGLKIGRQDLAEAFYPLEFDRYITIQSGSGMAAKNYPHYAEVVALMKPALDASGIRVVQLGGKDDPAIPGCHHLQGQTNLHQSSYVLTRSLCHVGNDSWMAHRAGYAGVPIVVSYGPTDPKNHAPYQYDVAKSVFIESHRFGRRPTFAGQEQPSTIALIPPEQIANATLTLLGLPAVPRQSLYFGDIYHQPMVQLVPDSVVDPRVPIQGPLIVRADLAPDTPETAQFITQNLQIRPCAILTDREIDLGVLTGLKQNVAAIRVEVGKVSGQWIKAVKRLGVQLAFFSKEQDTEKLARLRLDLYDACLFDQYVPTTKADFVKGAETYLNHAIDMDSGATRMRFKTKKLLLSDGKVFLSEAHWRAGRPTPSADQTTGEIIDNETFWEELSGYYLYTHE